MDLILEAMEIWFSRLYSTSNVLCYPPPQLHLLLLFFNLQILFTILYWKLSKYVSLVILKVLEKIESQSSVSKNGNIFIQVSIEVGGLMILRWLLLIGGLIFYIIFALVQHPCHIQTRTSHCVKMTHVYPQMWDFALLPITFTCFYYSFRVSGIYLVVSEITAM